MRYTKGHLIEMSKTRQRAGRLISMAAAAGGLWLLTAPAAGASTGTQSPGATITFPSGQQIPFGVSEPSNTEFVVALPPQAACSGDNSAGFVIDSFVVDNSVVPNPGTLTFPAGTPSQGTVLIEDPSIGSTVYSAILPVPTSGQVPSPVPPFNWDNFAGNFGSSASSGLPLYPGTFNVGIMCAQGGNGTPDKWWNSQIIFAASTSDPNGFTWSVVNTSPPPTPEAPLAIALPLSALGVAGASVFVLRRRRRSTATPVV
jgi:hypothetical protein